MPFLSQLFPRPSAPEGGAWRGSLKLAEVSLTPYPLSHTGINGKGCQAQIVGFMYSLMGEVF